MILQEIRFLEKSSPNPSHHSTESFDRSPIAGPTGRPSCPLNWHVTSYSPASEDAVTIHPGSTAHWAAFRVLAGCVPRHMHIDQGVEEVCLLSKSPTWPQKCSLHQISTQSRAGSAWFLYHYCNLEVKHHQLWHSVQLQEETWRNIFLHSIFLVNYCYT